MTSATEPGYWVNHCEGFDIEWDGERVGVVEAVVYDERGEPRCSRYTAVPVPRAPRGEARAQAIPP